MRLVEHLVQVRVLWRLVLLRIAVFGRLLEGLGADGGWRMLSNLRPDVGIAVVRISGPLRVFAAVPVAVTAGAIMQRLAFLVS